MSDGARERAWLQAGGCSYSEREYGAGRGSLHRLVRSVVGGYL